MKLFLESFTNASSEHLEGRKTRQLARGNWDDLMRRRYHRNEDVGGGF
jgi:hypothetical protein